DVYDSAIQLFNDVTYFGHDYLAAYRADALAKKGKTLLESGRVSEALTAYDQSISTRAALPESEWTCVASAMLNKGGRLRSLGCREEALALQAHTISMLADLIGRGQSQLASALATALQDMGNTLHQVGRLEEAVGACDRIIALCAPLVQRGRADLAS